MDPESLTLFVEFLEAIWQDNTEEEAFVEWHRRITRTPVYADESLACMTDVINHPPKNLVKILNDHGWISLVHEHHGKEVDADAAQYLTWLTAVRDAFQAIYDDAPTDGD